MAKVDPSAIRNVAVVGHRGCGKTSLVESMLFAAGAVNRRGSVQDGTTVSDWDAGEQRRGMSISASLCHLSWNGAKVNLIDTPGEPSFVADALSALAAVDAALLVVDAVSGVQVQATRLAQRAGELGISRIAVVNMLDRDEADFDATVDGLRGLAEGVVPIHLPIRDDGPMTGLVDVISMTSITFDGNGGGTAGEIPDAMLDEASAAREALMDLVAEGDDDLLLRYLEGETISPEEVVAGLRAGVREGRLMPVACAAAGSGAGAQAMLDALVGLAPSPAEVVARHAVDSDTGEEAVFEPSADGEAVAYCFKTMADQFSGKVNILRVLTGTLSGDTYVTVAGSGEKERIGQLFTLQGKEHVSVDLLGPGDIGAVAKLKHVVTGDVLSTEGHAAGLAPVEYPAAMMTFAVTGAEGTEDDKMVPALRRIAEEDPTISISRDEETGDLLLSGLSQMHVEVVVERVKERFGVHVELHQPRVPYRETITAEATAEGKHKKQTGGRGQFGDCWLRVEPLPSGEGFEFVNKVVGGAIPRQYIPAVGKGVEEAMAAGPIAGYPVVDVRVTLYDGKHHSVDSSEMAFKIAGSLGMRAAMEKAQPVLLEPIVLVEVVVPQQYVGDVMGDLNSRRGHPLGMDSTPAGEVVRAEVPMAEMLSYAPDLRAMTHGEGDYTMEVARYQQAPPHVAEKLAQETVAA
jgi:elongation factor G